MQTKIVITMKISVSKFILLIAISMLFSSCEEVIDLELRSAEAAALVVEAEVVDVEGYSFVKLSRTLDFYDPSEVPMLSGAVVSVTDDNGTVMPFVEDTNQKGYYYPQDESYKGRVGGIYNLRIETGGKIYTSESKLLRVTPIDSVQVRFKAKGRFNEEGYYLYFYAKEPQETTDYYLWRTYVNDTLQFDGIGDLLYSADDAVGEDIEGLELPFAFEAGDTVRLEQYSITRETFDFYDDLVSVAFSDGGIFSPPPVNPRTNIKGGNVIGVFSTSSMVSITAIIPKEE